MLLLLKGVTRLLGSECKYDKMLEIFCSRLLPLGLLGNTNEHHIVSPGFGLRAFPPARFDVPFELEDCGLSLLF